MRDKQTLIFICYIYYNGWVGSKESARPRLWGRRFKSTQCRANVVQMKILTQSPLIIGFQLIDWIIIKTGTRGLVL